VSDEKQADSNQAQDPELWFTNGDCLVYFYAEGQSTRGPSLRLWLADIEGSNCRPLLEKTCSKPVPDSPQDSASPRLTNFENGQGPPAQYEIFIPAPSHLNRDEAMSYHITTRNFFAWMFEKPIVGAHLGKALVGLLQRMNQWRPDKEENEDDFLAYIDHQGYTDFRECPDHALAVLHWAEECQHAELWTDSFVHCVGMNNQLVSSHEFPSVSRTTKAMITRASLDIAVRLDRASAELANFCEEDEVVNTHLQLSSSTLKHLERFRSFLHCFYVQRHGYWPPHIVRSSYGKIRPLPKHTFITMYTDFRNLYEYLVDTDADPDFQPEASRSLVNALTMYDKRQKFTPLPHLLPRLPKEDFEVAELRRKATFSVFGAKKLKKGKRAMVASSLASATNVGDMKVISSGIVREYALFEREYTVSESERISASEARMARWVLIYAILQTLISVTHAPPEVRDVEGVDYPLCAQTAGTPPWKSEKIERIDSKTSEPNSIAGTISKPSIAPSESLERSAQIGEDNTSPIPLPLNFTKIFSKREELQRPRTAPENSSAKAFSMQPFNLESSEVPKITPPTRKPTNKRASTPKPSKIPIPVARSRSSTPVPVKDLAVPSLPPLPPTPTTIATITPAQSSLSDLPPPSTPPPIRPRSQARRLVTRGEPVQCPQPQRLISYIEPILTPDQILEHISEDVSPINSPSQTPSAPSSPPSPLTPSHLDSHTPALTSSSTPTASNVPTPVPGRISPKLDYRKYSDPVMLPPVPPIPPTIAVANVSKCTRDSWQQAKTHSNQSSMSSIATETPAILFSDKTQSSSLSRKPSNTGRFSNSRQSKRSNYSSHSAHSSRSDQTFHTSTATNNVPPTPLTPISLSLVASYKPSISAAGYSHVPSPSNYSTSSSNDYYDAGPDDTEIRQFRALWEQHQFGDSQQFEDMIQCATSPSSLKAHARSASGNIHNINAEPKSPKSPLNFTFVSYTPSKDGWVPANSPTHDSAAPAPSVPVVRQAKKKANRKERGKSFTQTFLSSASSKNKKFKRVSVDQSSFSLSPTALTRPRHRRDPSSELAKSFRKEINWKQGPGWTGDVDDLLRGD
jgi:hypothetical protein